MTLGKSLLCTSFFSSGKNGDINRIIRCAEYEILSLEHKVITILVCWTKKALVGNSYTVASVENQW